MSDPTVWLMCGRPGTLKTSIATALAGQRGMIYLPPRAGGALGADASDAEFQARRAQRYTLVAEAAGALVAMGCSVVVDGGWLSRRHRALLYEAAGSAPVFVLRCIAQDEDRRERLVRRSGMAWDHESAAARAILVEGEAPEQEDDPADDAGAAGILLVNTSGRTVEVVRAKVTPPAGLVGVLEAQLRMHFSPHALTEVRTHFDNLASDYDGSTEWRREPALLESLFATLDTCPARVLDVGAGTGLASAAYAAAGHTVVGIDLSPRMIARADRLACAVLGDACALPFPDMHFDLVILRQVLHYVDVDAVLAECRRVLRLGGRAVVASAVAPDDSSARFLEEYKAVTQPLRRRVFTERTLGAAMDQAGLVVSRAEHHRLARRDEIASLMRRGHAPPSGWNSFLQACTRIAAHAAPTLNFRFEQGSVEYFQDWVTLWSIRPVLPG